MKNSKKCSFKTGMQNIKVKDVFSVKTELKKALNITSDWGLQLRINGKYKPTDEEINGIESVFNKYEIKEIWD